jgi:hypothetical protein
MSTPTPTTKPTINSVLPTKNPNPSYQDLLDVFGWESGSNCPPNYPNCGTATSFDLKNKRKIGKDVVYDTFYHVFATLTIKDSKKEGVAKFYTKIDQTKPFAELPFSNDMLNGSVKIYQSLTFHCF